MKAHNGFTLIELLIATVIVGILAAIAIPSYQSYVVKSNRAAAQAFMVDAASREKQYLIDARSYANDLTALGVTPPADVRKHYSFTVTVVATPPSFIIQANPTSSQQTGDGALTLTSDGAKTPADKW